MKPPTNCRDCGEVLEIHNIVANSLNGIANRCRTCWNKYCLERYHSRKSNPDYKAKRDQSLTNSHYKRKYGITLEQYEYQLNIQLGGCAVCKQACETGNRLAVDHNHSTGKIRGLLCKNCNIALGALKEDEDLIWNMLEYLKEHSYANGNSERPRLSS